MSARATPQGTLNEQQERIAAHLEGPALVIAGAGSGKTRVITHRVARLIAAGVPPSAILMMTFTNKAAEEMRLRVSAQAGLSVGSAEEDDDDAAPSADDAPAVPASRTGRKGRTGRTGRTERGKGTPKGLMAGTFHSVANRFLRRYANLIGYERNFTILDATDARELIKAAIAECVVKSERKFPTAAVVQSVLSMAFNRNLELGALLQREYPWLDEWVGELEAIQTSYQRKKKSNNAMDFDDLLDNWHALLAGHMELELANRIRYILVDEYQDTNHIQAEVLALLARKHGNLMVVGDDAQSIYGWRGANFENILGFPERFGAQVYRLEQNYRSTPDILALANASINHNTAQFEKHLTAVRPHLETPQITHVRDEYEEADHVLERLLAYRDQEIPLDAMGVLYRNHAQSAALQMRLTQAGIPFIVRSGVKFFEQSHIKDVVAFLKVIFNPLDEIAWMRILKLLPGVGNTTAQRIYRVFAEQRAVRLAADNEALRKAIPAKAKEAWAELAATFKQLLEDGVGPSEMMLRVTRGFYHATLFSQFDNAREREADLTYLAEFAGKYTSVERFLSQLALVGGQAIRDHEEAQEEDPEFLTLTSIHQAKGLEWDVVFIIGLADGRFPHARSLEPQEKLEEERRLFYVAATRCMRYLEMTVPLVTYTGGRPEICRPSRFVEEIPPELVQVRRMESADSLRPYLGLGARMSVDW